MHIGDSVNELIKHLEWSVPETAMGVLYNCLMGASPYTHYVVRASPLCGREVLPAQK